MISLLYSMIFNINFIAGSHTGCPFARKKHCLLDIAGGIIILIRIKLIIAIIEVRTI